ncbi:hypothetical protein NLX86_04895 [Streptomyces sp. A3M-1-3]|uniref:hypothetical protein n=1 Tax=Streptomyces sp. A3M-1-3 TaxID=2962044 RepID=UPI0020B81CF3|nr:hypothetical protein [Streptomyces sp. A3M-1-3]MCP3817496.1 hypothetical protein [Streptomyces sp. A3M-1-3]
MRTRCDAANSWRGLTGATTGAILGPAPAASARPSLSGLEDLLLYRQQAGTALGPDPTVATVTAAVDAARRDFGACRYDPLARTLPSRIALAQALGAEGYPEQAATSVAELALLAAEQAAPQEVRRGSVRNMAADLLRHDRSLPGVRTFATRIGALT